MKKLIIVTLLSLGFFGQTVNAELKWRDYERLKVKEPLVFEAQLSGMLSAYGFANAILMFKGERPIYCPPSNMSLNVQNAMDIIEKQAGFSKSEKESVIPIQAMLFYGLTSTFPCSK